MISLDSPQEMSMPGWFLPDDGGEEGRGVVVLLWVMLCKYDTRPPACHTSIHIPHLQIAPYSQSHPFPYTSIHIWICRNIDIFLKFTKATFSCHGTLLSHWKYCWCDPCEWRYPVNTDMNHSTSPRSRRQREKYVKSTTGTFQGTGGRLSLVGKSDLCFAIRTGWPARRLSQSCWTSPTREYCHYCSSPILTSESESN